MYKVILNGSLRIIYAMDHAPNICDVKGAWKVPEMCLKGAWDVPERCLRCAWKVPEMCLRDAWEERKLFNSDSTFVLCKSYARYGGYLSGVVED